MAVLALHTNNQTKLSEEGRSFSLALLGYRWYLKEHFSSILMY